MILCGSVGKRVELANAIPTGITHTKHVCIHCTASHFTASHFRGDISTVVATYTEGFGVNLNFSRRSSISGLTSLLLSPGVYT